ncbi:hypothetical protein DL771_005080 [Monosporascus sp. 5C6A]|nr:hypothetical protein DL771_005080 [Monosporascus sp. 5C6A]
MRQLCVIKNSFVVAQNKELTKKRKEKEVFSSTNKKLHECTFDIKAITAPADIWFEFWSGAQKFAKNNEPRQIS